MAAILEKSYSTGEFAARASVSVRTLRFYDREGLLKPAARSGAGHRRYTERDLAPLQRILALKLLGFSLAEIRALLGAESRDDTEALKEALEQQRRMLEDKRTQISRILNVLARAQARLEAGTHDPNTLRDLIEVMQMDEKETWVDAYFTPEQQATLKRLSDDAYSDAAKATMAAWPTWTEADQGRIDAEYARLAATLKRLVAQGADPGSEEAQAAAALQADLIAQFTRGDPAVEAGLNTFWQHFDRLPEAEKPPALPWGPEEAAFLEEALRLRRERL